MIYRKIISVRSPTLHHNVTSNTYEDNGNQYIVSTPMKSQKLR